MFSWLFNPGRVSVPDYDTYVITPSSNDIKWVKRRTNILEIFKRRKFKNFEFVRGATGPTSIAACAASHAFAVNKALERKTFKPFLLLEDDAQDELHAELKFKMPHDADAMYLGLSHGGVDMAPSKEQPYIHKWNGNYYTLTNDQSTVRIYNMLATHAVVINSERFARNWLMCCNESLSRNIPFDIFLGLTHSDFNVYAQRYGMFYQASALGGVEEVTRGPLGGHGIFCVGNFLSLTNATRPLCYTHLLNNPFAEEHYEQQKETRQAELQDPPTPAPPDEQADGVP